MWVVGLCLLKRFEKSKHSSTAECIWILSYKTVPKDNTLSVLHANITYEISLRFHEGVPSDRHYGSGHSSGYYNSALDMPRRAR